MGVLARTLSFLTIMLCGQSAFSQDNSLAPRPVIVELFTSQGCSSCPPADQVLKYLKENNPNVLPLSMHVDYWDYIGWKDPFSSSIFTQRQSNYASAMGKRRIYTPQMVIDGKFGVVGAYYKKVEPLISKALQSTVDIPMHVRVVGNNIEVSVLPHLSKSNERADIVVIGYDSEAVTKVTRGENSGETITNSNIVKYIKNIGKFEGNKVTVTGQMPDTDNVVVILQRSGQRHILGIEIL